MRLAPLAIVPLVLMLGACESTTTPDDDDFENGGLLPTSEPGEQDADLGPMITREFTESDENLLNPERGYYVSYNLLGGASASYVRDGGHTLAIAQVDLRDYRNKELDDALLAGLEAGFARVRAAGIKVILRFRYNSSFSSDAPKARILGHIEQLTPLLQAHADVIAVMQAGFIGAWGEWHASTNGLDNDADRAEILDAILTALPPSRGVQVRRPMFKEAYLPGGPLEPGVAHDGSPGARIGHHNDCFLASESDFGTYDQPVSLWESYVAEDGRFTAIGGETCALYPPKTDCDAAIGEMETAHWSYLNRQYHQGVLGAWATQGCAGEIERRLGYRFALARVAHTEAVAPGGVLALEIDVRNRGFAAPFNGRHAEIVLTDGTTRHVARLAGIDPRRWEPGTTTTLTVRLRIPAGLVPGSYTVALRLPDPAAGLAADPRYAIRLANADVWSDLTGDNVLTRELTVDLAAPGPRDPTAHGFFQLP